MNKIKIYLQATRPFSFTVSLFPPVLAALFFLNQHPMPALKIFTLLLTLLGALSAHASANLIADYFDFKYGIDRQGTFGSSGVLTHKLLQPEQILRFGLILLIFAASIAFWFILNNPQAFTLTAVILIGALLAIFYTSGPFPLKYKACGDVAVFIAFGPAMSFGAYLIFSAESNFQAALLLLPPAFIVTAVLHANNTRDISSDAEAEIKTVAMKLGLRGALIYYRLLLISAYICLLLLVFFKVTPVHTLIALLSLPMANKLAKTMKKAIEEAKQPLLISLDAQTARLHALFSLLYGAGFLLKITFFNE